MRTACDIAIITVARNNNYLYRTIASLGPDIAVTMVIGSPDSAYIHRYRVDPRINIIEVDDEWDEIKDKTVHHRACWNYWRGLVNGASQNLDLLLFEDDVEFAIGWQKRFLTTKSRIDDIYNNDYLLALYTPYDFVEDNFHNNDLFAVYPVDMFYGCQGLFYTAATRAGFAQYLKSNGVDRYTIPYDLLLKQYLKDAGIPLLSTVPCLVQHIGETTTGLGDFHQAGYFVHQI